MLFYIWWHISWSTYSFSESVMNTLRSKECQHRENRWLCAVQIHVNLCDLSLLLPSIAQLAERRTVDEKWQVSLGRWFNSGSKDELLFDQLRIWSNLEKPSTKHHLFRLANASIWTSLACVLFVQVSSQTRNWLRKISFEPESNQRPKDDYECTPTVLRSTSWAIEGYISTSMAEISMDLKTMTTCLFCVCAFLTLVHSWQTKNGGQGVSITVQLEKCLFCQQIKQWCWSKFLNI